MKWISIICKTESKFSYHPRCPKHPVLELVCKPEVVEKKEGSQGGRKRRKKGGRERRLSDLTALGGEKKIELFEQYGKKWNFIF